MTSQDTFDLYADKPMLGQDQLLTYTTPRKSRPPPRRSKSSGGRYVFAHYALARCHLYPPTRSRIRPEAQPIDKSRFVHSPILPHPEHPLICRWLLLPAYETEKDMSAYQEKHGMHPTTLVRWVCRHCGFIHAWTTPSCMFDTNGGSCAGAYDVPSRIITEYMHPKSKKLFRFVKPEDKHKGIE